MRYDPSLMFTIDRENKEWIAEVDAGFFKKARELRLIPYTEADSEKCRLLILRFLCSLNELDDLIDSHIFERRAARRVFVGPRSHIRTMQELKTISDELSATHFWVKGLLDFMPAEAIHIDALTLEMCLDRLGRKMHDAVHDPLLEIQKAAKINPKNSLELLTNSELRKQLSLLEAAMQEANLAKVQATSSGEDDMSDSRVSQANIYALQRTIYEYEQALFDRQESPKTKEPQE